VRGKDRRIKREDLEEATSERLAAIVAAAERAATQVIDDAEREASRQLADARAAADAIAAERLATLATQADSLIAQAEEIRQRSEQLLASLSQVKAQLEANPGKEPNAPNPVLAPRASHLSAVAPAAEPDEPAEPEPQRPAEEPVAPPRRLRDDRDGPAGARLLATQMAISGSSREEIAERLRNGFEIDDPEAILEAILGPEE